MNCSSVNSSGRSSPAPVDGAELATGVAEAAGSATGVATGLVIGTVALALETGEAETTGKAELAGVEGVVLEPEPKRGGPGTV
jgi:hypothetical protein